MKNPILVQMNQLHVNQILKIVGKHFTDGKGRKKISNCIYAANKSKYKKFRSETVSDGVHVQRVK